MNTNLSNSKLIAYSAAAGAAIAIAPNAFGAIQNGTEDLPLNFGFGNGGIQYLTMEGSGQADAEFKFGYGSGTFNIKATYDDSAKVCNGTSNFVYDISENGVIGPLDYAPHSTTGKFNPHWTEVDVTKMCGVSFKLEDGSDIVYAWIAVEKIGNEKGRITAWAYQDDGTPIQAGDTGPVPEPATGLALLALGAAGIAAYRRR